MKDGLHHYILGAINALISYGAEKIEIEPAFEGYNKMFFIRDGKRFEYHAFKNMELK